MITVTPTKPSRLAFLRPVHAAYLRFRIGHAEEDARHAEAQAELYRKEAQRLRVELARLGGL